MIVIWVLITADNKPCFVIDKSASGVNEKVREKYIVRGSQVSRTL